MKHILCKLTGGLKDNATIRQALLDSASNLDIKQIAEYEFKNPSGITMILLLGESHYSIHTFYENNYYMVDLFTCNPNTPCKDIIRRLAKLTNSKIEDIVELERD